MRVWKLSRFKDWWIVNIFVLEWVPFDHRPRSFVCVDYPKIFYAWTEYVTNSINMLIHVILSTICIFLIISSSVIIDEVNCQREKSRQLLVKSHNARFGDILNSSASDRGTINLDQSASISAVTDRYIAPPRLPRFTQTRDLEGVNSTNDDRTWILGMFNFTDHPLLCQNITKTPRGRVLVF